jgi:hypothetical protein
VDYSKLNNAKLYEHRGMDAEKDVEKVYFDGKAVYAPGLTTAVVFIDGTPVTLKGESSSDDEEETVAAAPAVPSSEAEECDEYDPDCEEEDDDDISSYKTSAPIDNTADDRDYAASDAARDVGDRFGIADEVRFWTAVGLSALAVTAAVVGIMQHMEANKAGNAYDELSDLNNSILHACDNEPDRGSCEAVMARMAKYDDWTLASLQKRMNENKKTQDSYASARNIWFGISAASIAGAVVLFVW